MYYRKLRIRRDAAEENSPSETKSQESNGVSKPFTNSGASVSSLAKTVSSETTGTATSHKSQIIETRTLSTNLNETDLWDTVDRPDTVINKTFEDHIHKNESWKVGLSSIT